MPSTSLVCLFLLCHEGVCLEGLESGRLFSFEIFAIVSIQEGNECLDRGRVLPCSLSDTLGSKLHYTEGRAVVLKVKSLSWPEFCWSSVAVLQM